MYEFKVGDEVVCVDAEQQPGSVPTGLQEGVVYTIARIGLSENPDHAHEIVVFVNEARNDGGGILDYDTGYAPRRFRKVQRRNLQEWLKQAVGNTDKLDNRQKVGA